MLPYLILARSIYSSDTGDSNSSERRVYKSVFMTAEHLDWVPKRGVVSIVGDYTFPLGTDKFLTQSRKRAFNRIIGTIGYCDPSILYGMPSEGVNLCVLAAISQIDSVKTIYVNPCPGFFNYITEDSKELLRHLVSEGQTITMHEKPQGLTKGTSRLKESLEYLANTSDAVFLVYDSNNTTKRFEEVQKLLSMYDDKVILVDYATQS